MTRPLALLRPAPGWDRSAAAARALGLEVIGAPLFQVIAASWDSPDPASIDAVLLPSANVLRHGGGTLAALAGKPAYAVGAATAEAARAAGFDVVATGDSDLQALAAAIDPRHRRLLRLTGRGHGAFTPPAGATVIERVVYAAEALPLAQATAAALARPAVVALHSPRAAQHFAAECDRLGIERAHLVIAALSPRVAAAAGPGWKAVASAATPDDAALLALAAQMCKIVPPSTEKPPPP